MPEHKTMVFVDGENFAIRGREALKALVGDEQKGPIYEPSTFLWVPSSLQGRELGWYGLNPTLFPPAVRSYYFSALKSGNNQTLEDVAERLKALDFEPNLFTTKKSRKEGEGRVAASKLVDQSLTVTALHHAYGDHYDTAMILAGDADYIPLIQELKSMGKRVHVAFFGEVVPSSLRMAGDKFFDLTGIFEMGWNLLREKKQILYFGFRGMQPAGYELQGYEIKPHFH